MLWNKLSALGLHGNILNCLTALYENVKYCFRVNGCLTDWFPVDIGVKQGCILSPILFAIYINDLSLAIEALGKGVSIDDEKISMHFRNPSMPRSEFSFSCGSFSLETAKDHKYLGLMLTEFLD